MSDYEYNSETIKKQINTLKENKDNIFHTNPENKTIIILVPNVTIGFGLFDIFTIFYDFMKQIKYMEKKIKTINYEKIKKEVKEIFFKKLNLILNDYLKALRLYLEKTENKDYMFLFY